MSQGTVCHRVHHLCVTGYTVCVSQGTLFVCHRVYRLCVTGYTVCVYRVHSLCHRLHRLCVTGYTVCVSQATQFVCHRLHRLCVTGYTVCVYRVHSLCVTGHTVCVSQVTPFAIFFLLLSPIKFRGITCKHSLTNSFRILRSKTHYSSSPSPLYYRHL